MSFINAITFVYIKFSQQFPLSYNTFNAASWIVQALGTGTATEIMWNIIPIPNICAATLCILWFFPSTRTNKNGCTFRGGRLGLHVQASGSPSTTLWGMCSRVWIGLSSNLSVSHSHPLHLIQFVSVLLLA